MWTKLYISIVIVLMLGGGYLIYWNSLPKQLFNLEVEEIDQITIFDGNSGEKINIKNRTTIGYLVQQLDGQHFQKQQSSKEYSGFRFNIHFLDTHGNSIQSLTINTEDTIVYEDFFYEILDHRIDDQFIEQLFREEVQ